MSAKRPRPAVPVLVHVDNPAEVGSVTVDTSTIEGKMDTVITNQNRIYDKIPTSSGGSSADLTTVNANTTALAEAIGPASSTLHDSNLFGRVRNLVAGVGDFDIGVSGSGTTVRALLYNIRDGIGDKFNTPTATETTVRGLLTAIKENTASGGSGGGADLTTVNEKITALAAVTGTLSSSSKDTDLIGCVRNLRVAIGVSGNELSLNDTNVRSILYNIRTAIGSGSATPTLTGTSVRDLLTQIKENTASGGGGGSADLTTVNEKTTALAAAIGSASDDSSTVSVIGLLKSITDKY